MSVRILVGDCIERMADLEAGSVNCIVTSPPYWGLRDYGVEGQMGLEESPAAFVAALVEVFREARRVLSDDGTLWLNLGDSYVQGGRGGYGDQSTIQGSRSSRDESLRGLEAAGGRLAVDGLGPKQMVGIPWRVAFALQDDGWILRSDIIWAKTNPMPESVADRPTKAHEYLFLLAKSTSYFYDGDAVREPYSQASLDRYKHGFSTNTENSKVNGEKHGSIRDGGSINANPAGRNRRTVWSIPTKPFRGAHFATFPPDLVRPCILAGCPAGGTVLDPFAGAGTVGLVADRLGRDAVLIELNPKYAEMARGRIVAESPLLARVDLEVAAR